LGKKHWNTKGRPRERPAPARQKEGRASRPARIRRDGAGYFDDVVLPVLWLVVSVEVWLPVVALVLLLSDWSPVDVVLSMLNDERPRRSMFGLTVEVEPVWLLLEFAVDPVIEDVVPEVDPVVDAVDGVEVDALEGVPEAEAEGLAPLDEDVPELAAVSGAQSSCTGLAECSFASPVDLLASLPALGCARPDLPASRLLHGGRLELDAVVPLVPMLVDVLFADVLPLPLMLPLAEGCVADLVELVVCANAGAAIMAATASALMNWERIMSFLLVDRGQRKLGTGPRRAFGRPASKRLRPSAQRVACSDMPLSEGSCKAEPGDSGAKCTRCASSSPRCSTRPTRSRRSPRRGRPSGTGAP
jgi:hypothetical protein